MLPNALSRSLIYDIFVHCRQCDAEIKENVEPCNTHKPLGMQVCTFRFRRRDYIVCPSLFPAGPFWPYWHCWLSVLHNSLSHLFASSVGAASGQILVDFLLFRCSHANCEDGAWEAWSARSLELWEKRSPLEVL